MARPKSAAVEMKLAQARKEYVESRSSPTLKDVAEMFGLGLSTVKERSSEGNWAAERAAFQGQLSTEIAKREVPSLADQASRIQVKMYETVETAIDTLNTGLKTGQLRWDTPKQATDTVGHLFSIMREAGLLTSAAPAVPAQNGAQPAVPRGPMSVMQLVVNTPTPSPVGKIIDVTPEEAVDGDAS